MTTADEHERAPGSSGSVALGLNMQATWRMIAIAFVCAGAVVTAAIAALVVSFVDDKAFPRDMGPAYFQLFVVVGIVLAGASFGVVWLRQPRGARIDWSEWGITEWDGDGVRCAIPRATLRMGSLVTKMQAKNLQGLAAGAVLHDAGLAAMPGANASSGTGFVIGGALTLGDDDGRRIYAGQGTQFIWLNDRLSTVANIKPLLDGIGEVPGMPPEIGRSGENKLVGVYLLGIIHYVTLLLAAMVILVGNADNEPGVLLLLAASTLFGSLRALVPVVRAARVNRGAKQYTERATIEGNDGTSLLVNAGGQSITLDPRPWKHPDAALHQRRGTVWLTKERDGLETDGMRAARRSRVLALRIEALARASLAACAALLLASQLAVFEKWKNVVKSTNAVTPVFFDGTYLLRMNQGAVERAHEDVQRWLPLRGTPSVFAPGPSNTITFRSGNGPVIFQSIGSDYVLNPKSPLPPARMIVSSEDVNAGGAILVVTTSGEGQLWRYHSIDVAPTGKRLAKSLATATMATFTERGERVLVAYQDGSVDSFDPETGALQFTLPARGHVKAIAPRWSIAVADDRGVRWFDDDTGAPEGSVALANVVVLEYGDYPTWMHQANSAWLAITSVNGKHTLHAVDSEGRIDRTFDIPLPRGEKPVALTTTPREVLVATDKGGVWQLWIH